MESKYPRLDENGNPKPLIRPFNWTGTTSKHAEDKCIINTNDESVIDTWPDTIDRIYDKKLYLAAYGVLGKSAIIFDLDVKHGKNGVAEFEALRKEFDIPEPIMTVTSKSGGLHAYYRRPDKLAGCRIMSPTDIKVQGITYKGVDIRGDKAYVVGPEMVGDWDEGVYAASSVVDVRQLTCCPQELCEELLDKSVRYADNPLASMIGAARGDETAEDLAKKLIIPPKVESGERNTVYYAFVNAAIRRGLPERTLRGLIEQLKAVTEDLATLPQSVDVEDMIERAYKVDTSNPYAIAQDMVRKGMYRLSSHALNAVTYFTTDKSYIAMDRPMTEAQVAELTARFDRQKVNKDGSVSSRVDNVGKLLKNVIPRDNEVSRLGYVPGGEVICRDESGRLDLLNMWRDPRDLAVSDANFNDEVWEQFLWLTERLFGKPGTKEFQYGLEFPRWLLAHPGLRPVTYPLISSINRGTGKNLWVGCISHCMGYNQFGASQAKTYLKENLKNARFLNPTMYSLISFDEVEFAKSSGSYSNAVEFNQTIKTLSTCDVAPVEIKGGAAYDSPMYAGIVMTSNSVEGLVIDDEDRRTNLFYSTADPLNPKGGEVDDLFRITKRIGTLKERKNSVGTIITGLCRLQETMALDKQRAWDSDVKSEARASTMTMVQRCVSEYFRDKRPGAVYPITNVSLLRWIIMNHPDLVYSKHTEKVDDTIDELLRSTLLHRVNLPGQRRLRQFYSMPSIDLANQVKYPKSRCSLYTVGLHLEYGDIEASEVKQHIVNNT